MRADRREEYSLTDQQRADRLLPVVRERVRDHRDRCAAYDRILTAIDTSGHPGTGLAALPWLPARMFKTHELRSVAEHEVFRVATSSGTTGERSRVFLDQAAAAEQSRRVASAFRTVLGPARLPMMVVDTRPRLENGAMAARTASVVGLLPLGTDHTYLVDEDGRTDPRAVTEFLGRHPTGRFLLCGTTVMVWHHLYPLARDHGIDLTRAVLVHSGGWKRLHEGGVDDATFRSRLAEVSGLTEVFGYYGMVEQLGTIFLGDSRDDTYYCPDLAQVIIRDPRTWSEQPVGVPGVIEVISALPTSYPGNVVLTEDLGVVVGIDDGERPGRRFRVLGRLPRAEARGCGDAGGGPR